MKLLEQCPVLRELCDRTDKNFYQYHRKRGKIVQLPRNCINGLAVDFSRRKNYTISYLLASPGELGEPGSLLSEGTRKVTTKEKNDGKNSEENKTGSALGVEKSTAGEQDELLAFLEG